MPKNLPDNWEEDSADEIAHTLLNKGVIMQT